VIVVFLTRTGLIEPVIGYLRVDHPYDKATSEFIVKAPAKYKVVSNGLLLEESYLGNNLKTDPLEAIGSCFFLVICFGCG
jgi:hypothetical protein